MKIENPIVRIPAKLRRFEVVKFRNRIMSQVSTYTFRDLESQIAEHEFKKPIRLIGEWHIKPFWREGKEALPLPLYANCPGEQVIDEKLTKI